MTEQLLRYGLIIAGLFALLPFPTRAQSQPVLDARAFGARGDGRTDDTGAIQATLDAAIARRAVVWLHDGVFMSGTIRLKGGAVLRISPTATLKGIQDTTRYPDLTPRLVNSQLSNCRKSLIYAENADSITIEGGGSIDGSGHFAPWVGAQKTHPEHERPMAIFIVLSKHVTIRDVTVKDAGMWTIVNMQNEDVTLRNLHVSSLAGPNRDGIDVCDCHRVSIQNCDIESEDDSICLKSGSDFGLEDVSVTHCRVRQSTVANGLKFGTASRGHFRNVLFDTISVENVDKAAMAVESVDGATVRNVTYRNITVKNAGTLLFVLLGSRSNAPVGSIDDIHFQHIRGEAAKHSWGSAISGTITRDGVLHELGLIQLEDIHVVVGGGRQTIPADPPEYAGQYPDPNLWGDLPVTGLFIRHAPRVTLAGVQLPRATPDARRQGDAGF